ncbi:MAG: signal peptidase II [Oscillospiraceae bacterium]|nr:signal peptidase II [Oscillospiraceae bacterium]
MMQLSLFRNKKITQLIWLAFAAVIVIADQAVKRSILAGYVQNMKFGELPGVADFIYVKNTGAAFSMLSNNTFILGVLSVIFCVAVVIYWFIGKKKHVMRSLALTLLFAGALGNAIDRIAYGFVVDFISIKWFNFPVFNIADMAIVGGAIAAVIYFIFLDKEEPEHE